MSSSLPATKARNVTFHAFDIITLGETSHDQSAQAIWSTLTNPSLYDGNGICSLTTTHSSSGFQVEIRDFQVSGDFAMGCVARCREDSPPIRKQDRSEVLRPLQNGDTLLEKNYFLYSKNDRILIWQFNLSGNGYTTFANLLNTLAGGSKTFICAPMVNGKDMDFDTVDIEYVDFAISMPKAKTDQTALINDDPTNWGGFNPFRVMNDLDTQRFSAKFTAKKTKSFGERAIKFFSNISTQPTLRKLKVKIEDCDEPIDVLASRFKATESINFHQGQHLDSTSMFNALDSVWAKYQQQVATSS